LKIRRLQVSTQDLIELVKIDTNISSPTEIEEALDPEAFYKALKITIDGSDEEDIKLAFNNFAFDSSVKNSFVKGDKSIIYSIISDGETNPRTEKEKIIAFIDKNKLQICENYCSTEISNKLNWIRKIEEYFDK
jgi:hypothetical protein